MEKVKLKYISILQSLLLKPYITIIIFFFNYNYIFLYVTDISELFVGVAMNLAITITCGLAIDILLVYL